MTRSNSPENWQELLAGYALGDLSPEEAEVLQHLFTDDPERLTEADRLQDAFDLMAYSVPEQEPPARLKDKLLSMAQATPQIAEHITSDRASATNNATSGETDVTTDLENLRRFAQPGSKRRLTSNSWFSIGAIAAVALVALGMDNYRLRQETQESKSVIAALQRRGTLTYALEGTEQANSASGSLVVAEGQQVVIVAKDLPVLPAGEVYRLWAMPPSGKNPTFCGEFAPGRAGSVTTHWLAPTAACRSTKVQMLITAEKVADPPVPKGSLVMKSRI
jgi:Anti-sigma-K factor rskA